MKNYWKKWIKFLKLSWHEKYYFFASIALLILLKICLKILPFSTFRKIYSLTFSSKKKKVYNIYETKNIAETIKRAASVFPFSMTCLPQALATKAFLNKNDDFILKIGVQKGILDNFEAHAWVEHDGKIIIGDIPNFGYVPIWEWN